MAHIFRFLVKKNNVVLHLQWTQTDWKRSIARSDNKNLHSITRMMNYVRFMCDDNTGAGDNKRRMWHIDIAYLRRTSNYIRYKSEWIE